MKPAPISYKRPATLDEAVAALAEHGEEAKVLAGGQSLLPMMNMRLAVPATLVDVGAIAELRSTDESNGTTRYGAGVVHSDVEDGLVPDRSHGLLRAAAAGIGYRAIRNRGTVGGSLAHSDASAEWPVVFAALDATAVARSVRGERTVSCRQFVEGYFTNALADDEVLLAVDVPACGPRVRWGLHKLARKPGEFAESLAVVVAEVGDAGVIASAEVWLGAARDVPVRLTGVADSLTGHHPAELADADLAAAVERELDTGHDPDSRYATHLHGVAVARAVAQLTEAVAEEAR